MARWMVVLSLTAAMQSTSAPRVQLTDGIANTLLTRAVLAAQVRLGRPACQQVLSDFADQAGQSLLDRLKTTDLSAPDYLVQQVWFVDGDAAARCGQDHNVAAFTVPGHHVVHVCSARLLRSHAQQPVATEMIVIHEMLHTLGLGENPPSSAAITSQVTKRCGAS